MSSWAAEKRLDFIDDVLAGNGVIRRREICEYFGVTMAVASGDMQVYARQNPTLRYCRSSKYYGAARSVRNSTAARRAAWAVIGGVTQ